MAEDVHVVCGYSYVTVRCDGQSQPLRVYRGDANKRFLDAIIEEKNIVNKTFNKPKDIFMMINDVKNYEKSLFEVRDHCYLTGRYRGAAHSFCNLRLSVKPDKTIIPVVFHNLRGYNSRLKETSLPAKEAFYSKLNDENVTDKQYRHAQDVYREFNCKDFEYYISTCTCVPTFVYWRTCFENFRKTCLKQYGLDPAHY